MQRIVCAASRNPATGEIILGLRHMDRFMQNTSEFKGGLRNFTQQGFIDNRGEFLTRAEALIVARNAAQIVRRCGGDEDELFSENLY